MTFGRMSGYKKPPWGGGLAVDSQIDSRLRTSLEALTGGKLVKRQVDQTLDSQVDIFAEANKYRSVFIRPYT